MLFRSVATVRAARDEHLAVTPVDRIIEVIDVAVQRLLDTRSPVRATLDEQLSPVTGFDGEMIRLALTDYLKTFRRAELERFVAEDFTNPKVLDSFQPAAKGGRVRAYGPRVLAHVWAGNVPGLPLWSFICGLLTKAGNIGKQIGRAHV